MSVDCDSLCTQLLIDVNQFKYRAKNILAKFDSEIISLQYIDCKSFHKSMKNDVARLVYISRNRRV